MTSGQYVPDVYGKRKVSLYHRSSGYFWRLILLEAEGQESAGGLVTSLKRSASIFFATQTFEMFVI